MGSQPCAQVEGQLAGIKLFRAPPEKTTPQCLQLRGQLADATILFLKRVEKLDNQLSQSLGIGGELGLRCHPETDYK